MERNEAKEGKWVVKKIRIIFWGGRVEENIIDRWEGRFVKLSE